MRLITLAVLLVYTCNTTLANVTFPYFLIDNDEVCQTNQNTQEMSFTFDDGKKIWDVKEGKATLSDNGAYKGQALKISAGTTVCFKLPLQPASTYRLTAWLRTESGADNMSMQIVGLGKNNVSLTTALAAWTKCERTFNVSQDQSRTSRRRCWSLYSGILRGLLPYGWMKSASAVPATIMKWNIPAYRQLPNVR